MHFLDLTLPTPAENLACDEALLDAAEEGEGAEVLRFWEADSHFVVLGSSNYVSREVNSDECRKKGIPILRRRSGGGAVLQGPGCLNYCLILKLEGPCATIPGTNLFVLKRHAEALSALVKKPVVHEGLTDLAIHGAKISGNSQRRRLRYLLFHGTFLLHLDISVIESCLKSPSKEPDYRKGRGHGEFLSNIGLPPSEVKQGLRLAWNATVPGKGPVGEDIQDLVRTRYGTSEWNFKL